MSTEDAQQRAEHHAREAERLLTGRLGLIANYVKAGVHASLAVYYGGLADRASRGLAASPRRTV